MRICKKISVIIMLVTFCVVMWACGGRKKDTAANKESISTSTKEEEETKDEEKTSKQEQNTTNEEKIKVKDVVEKSIDNAKTILKAQGFQVSVEEEYSNDVQEGYVISQSPSAKNELLLSKGEVITLVVSKGKEPVVAKYLDSTVYADFVTGSPYNKMSAYSGKDLFGNECTRAIKFECNGDEEKHNNEEELNQIVKVTYVVGEGLETFSCTLAPVHFLYNLNYIHVNLYKDEEKLYSMDISKDTKPLELLYDIEGAQTFTIELTYLLCDSPYNDSASIVMSEAKFE